MLLDFVFVLGNTGAVGVWTLKGHLKCEGWLFGVGGCSCTFPSLQASIHKEVVTLRELPVEKNILAALRTASELKQHGFEIFPGLMISKDVTVVLPVHIVHMPEMHIGHCVAAQVWTEIEIFPGRVPLWPTIQLFPKYSNLSLYLGTHARSAQCASQACEQCEQARLSLLLN